MPELPEVETMRRGIALVVGAKIRAVVRMPCERRPLTVSPKGAEFEALQAGRTITAVERVGKRVVLRLNNGLRTVIEPRMTGLVLLSDPPTPEHLRLEWRLAGKRGVIRFWDRRGLGVVRVVDDTAFDQFYGPDKVGPDALTITPDEFQQRFREGRSPVKVALLDQTRVAGIGNLYAAEILHLAGVHPAIPCHRLTEAAWKRIHAATLSVLEDAVRYEGSTLGDGTYRNVLNQDGSYQNHHRVYARAGEACPSCKTTTIVRIVQAQRSTFYCPTCQKKSKRS
ncbi:MAG: bifunctional DNA-formamidopyrimidine glycosylase/DNA-(apurinic or apyrimidinic site) lyase [Pirellulales bacterium]